MDTLDTNWPTPKSAYGLTTNQRDFGRAVQNLAVMYSSPIILTRPNDQNVYHNATGFLFRPAGRTFLVTNAHVFDKGYYPLKGQFPDLVMVFANRVITPRLVSKNSDQDVDLAVIDVDGIEFEKESPGYWEGSAASRLTVYAPQAWPLCAPRDGEGTVAVGWPGKCRVHQHDSTEFAAFPLLGQMISNVSARWFTLQIERDQIISSDFDPDNKGPVQEVEFGGMSGTPVFALHRGGINPLELVGVVRDYGDLLDGLYCTRADLIQSDGTIGA